MKYQVRANLFFENEGQAVGLYNHALGLLPLATIVNPDTEAVEFSTIELIENRHDTNPNTPCDVVAVATNEPPI